MNRPTSRRRMPRPPRIGALAAVLAVLVLGFGAALAGVPAAYGASGPTQWHCDAKTLGLDKVTVQLAPVEKKERFSDGHRITSEPDPRGRWVPVILVHGWTSQSTHPKANGHTGSFSAPIDLSPNKFSTVDGGHSLVGQVQDIPGAAVFTYDYHPYSGRWVTDEHLGPGLGKVVDCLAKASGEKVIIVGHSMGGLIARYAASAPGPSGAKDRSGVISSIVTLGTPNTGSVAAAIVANVIDAVTVGDGDYAQIAATLRLILSACGEATTKDMDASLCSIAPPIAAFYGDAGKALRAGSSELAALKPVPKAIPVDALAGSTRFTVPKLGWFAMVWDTTDVPMGDLIVTEKSAESGSATTRQIACRYQLNPVRAQTDKWGLFWGLTSKNDVADSPLTAGSGPCFHVSLMRAQELAVEVAGAVGDDIRDRYLSREDLLTAPVPSLRGNHAGNLVDGVLPNTGGGYVGLERRGGAAPALGDLNGDGRGDAVAVITSSAGAGGTDAMVFAFTKRRGVLTRAAAFDPARATRGAYHAYVKGMVIDDGLVRLKWATSLPANLTGPDMAATLRLEGDHFVVSNLHEDDGATAAALPAYPNTEAGGQEMQQFLTHNGLEVVTIPIESGCQILQVYGANLASGDVDVIQGSSLCDGDPVLDFYSIRGGRVASKGWYVPENEMGDSVGWEAFVTPYGRRRPATFDVAPGESSYYLWPAT